RVDELVADARIGADAVAHVLDVRAQGFGQAGDLVHEADLGGQHRVGSVLGQLGGSDVHEDHAVLVAIKGCIELGHDCPHVGGVGAHDDAIGLHEVRHGG